jgi:quercetin dioxygenase-like cupin family protein
MTGLSRNSIGHQFRTEIGDRGKRPVGLRIILVALVGLASLFATSFSVAAFADVPSAATTLEDQRPGALVPFVEAGLPVGQTNGVPSDLTLDPGFTLKHVHGGPTYVYVVSGSFDIIDGDGATVTYHKGDFFSEPAGHVHTIRVKERSEVFVLQFLPQGAEGTIPVQ